MNDIVRQLTIIATIFLPLTAVTGFFGMNFEHIPWNSPLAFILTTLFILAIPVVMLRSLLPQAGIVPAWFPR